MKWQIDTVNENQKKYMNKDIKRDRLSRSSLQDVGIEGILMALSPLPLMLATLTSRTDLSVLHLDIFISGMDYFSSASSSLWNSQPSYLTTVLSASILTFISAFLILRRPLMGQICAGLALTGSSFAVMPYLVTDPFAALIGAIVIIGAGFYLLDFKVKTEYHKNSTPQERSLQRVRYSIITIPLLAVLKFMMERDPTTDQLLDGALTLSAIIVQLIFFHCALKQPRRVTVVIWSTLSITLISTLAILFYKGYDVSIAILISALITISILPPSEAVQPRYDQWWEMFLNHPARMLLTTFMVLCILGTTLLILPVSAAHNTINIVDAAFTSVSAVCVTGLIVVDTPKEFSVTGQIFILILIQLGGLGIMSITTVGMHAMGRRLTLRHERLLTNMTDTDHKDLIRSLITILKFTFTAEAIGALILSLLFYQTGDAVGQAIWRGGFTAVSAFCNAGFALQSDNLIPYNGRPLILHTVALLIIFGGIAPATSILVPRWISGKPIPVAAHVALITTAILLIAGALLILVFDWNGVLLNFSVADKIHNAWFQSVTLRTAGFNSVDIAGVTSPTFLLMICLMFIGGSPGGTAGGVKTTTAGILAMTFWANITNNKSVVILNRRVQSRIIYRAVTIVVSAVVTWMAMVLMVEVTQQIPASDIIFEVTSALGTVGLSTGATMHLDEIGKIIIMTTMFVGRIGPVTIFMLLSEERNTHKNPSRYQNAKISLT